TAQIFIYEHTPTEYFVIDLRDSVEVSRKEREIEVVQKTASAKITTSLWYAMIDNRINPLLAIELSEIFAWSIDFFGLQEDDEFKAIYEEYYLDTVSIGLGKIYTAYFRHAGEEFYAIPLIQDGEESYYDENGNSLKKAFLKAPLRFSRISSGFSYSRLHPILKIRRPHYGIDYAAPVGTPVLAIGDGRVIQMGRNGEAGNMVKIRHNSVYTTAYLHLSHYSSGMYTGRYVKQGETIGFVGSTGLSTGPHLDFRFYRNGSPTDPLRVKAPPVQPVKEENLETFNRIKSAILEILDTI
ncbi:MAG: peptidoglycan DD-metalloendopeptidase family protein, partial [Bacteroidales bacterium]